MTDFDPQAYRILAVDDSNVILRMVDTTLSGAGFQVITAESGEEALDFIKEHGLPHLALVDINMPFGMDGFEFCQKVHDFSDLPVIMLTVVEETEMVVQAIEEFAEDYITKPVSAGELVARVRRVLRSIGSFPYPLNQVTRVDGRLGVDFANCRAYIHGNEISLTPTETKLLYILMRDAGRVMNTDFLLQRLWPLEQSYEERLRVYIHRLRQKIEETPAEPHYIVSKRQRGYAFLPDGT
jgi:DNA-binding response OmpR family regulator